MVTKPFDGRPVFLTPVEVPDFCFLSEAVEWAALGRVPQAIWTEEHKSYGPVEYRFYWREMPDNFEISSGEPPWFGSAEFELLGIPMDEGYAEAAERCAVEDIRGLPERILEYENGREIIFEDEDGTVRNFGKERIAELNATLAELEPLQRFVDIVEGRFKIHFEVAWAKLFQLIVRGELICSAIDHEKWELLFEEEKYEEAGQFESVPPNAFSLGFDWKQNALDFDGKRYVSLRVETADILRHMEVLLPKGTPKSVEQTGQFFMYSSGRSTTFKRSRGRPSEIDWRALKSELARMMREGAVPNTKESCIYELIAYVERRYGKSPSRSSVQRNLSDELDLIYARK